MFVGLLVTTICVSTTPVQAQPEARLDYSTTPDVPVGELDDWSTTLKSRVYSRYLGSNGAIFHRDPVFQADITMAHDDGLYFNLWGSMGLESMEWNDDYGDEVDVTVGWAHEVSGISLDFGISYLELVDLRHSEDDVWWFYAEASKPYELTEEVTLSPFAHLDYYADAEFSYLKPYIEAGAYTSVQLCEDVSFDMRTSLLYDTGIFGFDSGFIGKANAGINWKWSETVTLECLNIKFAHSFIEEPSEDPRGDEIAFGVGVQVKF